MTTGHGLDISYAQGAVDLGAIVSAGPAFVGIRASFGTAGADSEFARSRAGLSGKVSALILYHFAYPNLNGPTAEANSFCDVVGALRPGEAVALDWEQPYKGNHQAWVEAWWAVVESRLRVQRPDEWDYGSSGTLSGLSADPNVRQRHLWLAWYPTGGGDPNIPPSPPAGFGPVDIWQHGSGVWAGQRVDDNWVYGGLSPLSTLSGGTAAVASDDDSLSLAISVGFWGAQAEPSQADMDWWLARAKSGGWGQTQVAHTIRDTLGAQGRLISLQGGATGPPGATGPQGAPGLTVTLSDQQVADAVGKWEAAHPNLSAPSVGPHTHAPGGVQ